jgi:hypothetical protein
MMKRKKATILGQMGIVMLPATTGTCNMTLTKWATAIMKNTMAANTVKGFMSPPQIFFNTLSYNNE